MTTTTHDRGEDCLVSPAAFRRLAAARLHPFPSERVWNPNLPVARTDWDLNPELAHELARLAVRPAAVLVGLVKRYELTVLLTQRTEHLPNHAGQVAFPGGKVDEADGNPVETALREAEEEIGLGRSHVEVLGYLDTYQTGTGFRVTPVVALVEPAFVPRPEAGEVAAVFEVPLRFLMDAANHQKHTRIWREKPRIYYAMPYGERYIWGATAGMIRNMYDRLFG